MLQGRGDEGGYLHLEKKNLISIRFTIKNMTSIFLITSSYTEIMLNNKANVNSKRVSGHIKADKTCGRAVIIIHYSIILPQHFLYMSKTGCLDKPW